MTSQTRDVVTGRRPNILLVTTDQQKADTLPLYGNRHVRTPSLDALAERGVVVDGHICNSPACSPARAAILTGRYPHTTGVRALHLHLPEGEITLVDALRRAGYETALIGKNHAFADGSIVSQTRAGLLALDEWPESLESFPAHAERLADDGRLADRRTSFDTWFTADHAGPEGAEHAELREFSMQAWLWRSHAAVATTPLPPERCTTGVLGARAAEFVRDRRDADRSWFLWLSFPDPHNPYQAPEPYASMYDPGEVDVPPRDSLETKPERQRIAHRMCGMHAATEDDVRAVVAMQYGQVSFLDTALGEVLGALAETGAESETIVVFTTDHGGYVGDHGAMHKSVAFYDALVRLPLVVSWPGTLPTRRASEGFLEQVDLMPTLLDLAQVPVPPGVQGRSQAAELAGGQPMRTRAFAECGEGRDPLGWDDLPFLPDDPFDDRFFGWDGFREGWLGQGKMIRTAEWKYAWYANGDRELYDLANDPHELVNVAGRPEHAGREKAFAEQLLEILVETEDPLPLHAWHVDLTDVLDGAFPWPAPTRRGPG